MTKRAVGEKTWADEQGGGCRRSAKVILMFLLPMLVFGVMKIVGG